MSHTFYRKLMAATLFAVCTALAGNAQVAPPPAPQASKPSAKIESFDDAQRVLQHAQAELARTLKNLKLPALPVPDKAELEQMIAELKQAAAEIENENNSVAIRKDAAASLKQAQEALSQLSHSKEMQAQMKEAQQKMQQQLEEANIKMEEAAKEMRQFEAFVNSLAADGLISKEAYRIEEKDGKLLIDGKEQPAAFYEKHQKFLKQNKGLKITKDENGLQIRKN